MAYRINPITCKLDYYEATNNSDLLIKIGLLMDINNQILTELKIMNVYLSTLVGDVVEQEDL